MKKTKNFLVPTSPVYALTTSHFRPTNATVVRKSRLKRYKGSREIYGADVTVDGQPLDFRFDLWIHSPTGFEWGCSGNGSAQLALAIVADCCSDVLAIQHHQAFKRAVVANLPYKKWSLTEHQVRKAIRAIESKTQ